ncbi:S8 family serine peptidase [Catenuloplanes sp. NPDC051500]|uniref:S8 family serine peptidase n=1 Tax=Catenuloplanes sp. NPDC051500 TaxID=3363959 RepID=UPI0037BAFF3B
MPVRRSAPVVAVLLTVLLTPVPARADDAPPALPTATDTCTGPSPVTSTATPWASGTLAAPSIWPLTRGDGITVAVLDTGVSAAAPALAGAVRPGTDVVTGGSADTDCRGRGTALAGIVAARPQSGAGVIGTAPDATILPVRITDSKDKLTPATLTAGVKAATSANVDVILLAAGVAVPDQALHDAVEAAADRDILIVAAVNGTAPTAAAPDPPIWYPAAFGTVLAVNAFGLDGAPGAVPDEAGTDLTGPGAGAWSIAPRGTGHYTVAGAGVAAAYVAGAAALVRAYHPGLSQAEVRDRLIATAQQPAAQLDAYAAVAGVVPAAPPPRPGAGAPPEIPRSPVTRSDAIPAALVGLGALAVTGAAFAVVLTRRRLRDA